jgi:hypothetical protein
MGIMELVFHRMVSMPIPLLIRKKFDLGFFLKKALPLFFV